MLKKLQQHIFHYRIKHGIPLLRAINRLRGKKRILLYTDSRGINIPEHFYYAHYPLRLAQKYAVEAHLVPHKSTTTADFLNAYENNKSWQNDFDFIILHTGIVGFSPRPVKQIHDRIYPNKKEYLHRFFGKAAVKKHYSEDTGVDYYGDKTQSIFSFDMAKNEIIPRLKKIPNLLFVGGTQIVPNWRGNYWRDRPTNLNMSEDFFRYFEKKLPNSIDLMGWTHEEIKANTYDGIHPNQRGSDILFELIDQKIEEMSTSKNPIKT